MTHNGGALWVIATPIGNLQDLSPRCKATLGNLSLLACETQSSARRLFSSLNLPCPPLILYREDSAPDSARRLLAKIEEGSQVGLISDAGSPCLSDPGWRLVSACHQQGLTVFSIPGPSALTAALSASGLPARRFIFEGFPPHKKSDRRKFFSDLEKRQETTVLFESPHNILETLQELQKFCGDERRLSISREISKIYESNQCAPILYWTNNPPVARGEFVLTLEGTTSSQESDGPDPNLEQQVAFLHEAGLSLTQIRDFLNRFHNTGRNQAYQLALKYLPKQD